MTTEIETVESFRARAGKWLVENMELGSADKIRTAMSDQEWSQFQRHLQRKVYDGGFAGVMYPKEYGGLGLSRAHQQAFRGEATPYVMPVHYAVTQGILGPTLLDFGTDEQKRTYIPRMLSGDIWVQLLSEPSGGSDMAGALTRATRDGDTYIINGSKIWSTSAHFCDYGLLLCRTNWDVPKHRGLSMVITPIPHPGVTVQTIELVDGNTDFCQEFIDDAMLPAANLLGAENDGWTVASRLLVHERSMVSGTSLDDTPHVFGSTDNADRLDELVELASQLGLGADPVVRQKVGAGLVLAGIAPHLVARIDFGMSSGRIAGPGAALLKLARSLIDYEREQLAFEVAGASTAAWANGHDAYDPIHYVRARMITIGGGTNEMQRNQISERVLGLPREANPDKDLPFGQTLHNVVRR